jgi:hypothetical protein
MSGSTRTLFLLLFAVALTPRSPVAASPLEDSTLGATVFTGPTQPHASSIQTNPAALGLATQGWHLFLGGSLRIDQVTIDRQLVDPQTGARTPGPTSSSVTPTPGGMLAAYWKGRNIAFGLASFIPRSERFISGQDPLRYHTLGGHFYQWTFADLATAFHWNRFWFSLALGVGNLESLRIQLARDTALENGTAGLESDCNGTPCGVENPAATQLYDIEVATDGVRPFGVTDLLLSIFSSENISLTAGILYQPAERWYIGLGYQGSPGLFGGTRRLAGTVDVTDAARDGGARRQGDAVVEYELPDTINLGVRGPMPRLPGYELVGSARWQSLFAHDRLDVRMFGRDLGPGVPEQYPLYRGMRHVFRLQLGLEQSANRVVRLGGRLLLERGAVSTRDLSPLTVATGRVGAAAGVEWRLGSALVIGGGYGLSWYPTAESDPNAFDPRERLACVDSGFDLTQCQAVRDGRARPTAAGTYARLEHALTASLRWDL